MATRPTGPTAERSAANGHRPVRVALGALGAAVLGAAPHVLHHVGPLAGAALLAGAAGTALFGLLGLVAAIPLLLRMRRRTGSWRWPSAALAAMAVGFLLSTLVIGPALAGDNEGTRPKQEGKPSPAEHREHHE